MDPTPPRESDRLIASPQDTKEQAAAKTELGRLKKAYYDVSNNPEADVGEIEDALARVVKGELAFDELVGGEKPDVSLIDASDKYKESVRAGIENKLKSYGADSDSSSTREQKGVALNSLFKTLENLVLAKVNFPDLHQ